MTTSFITTAQAAEPTPPPNAADGWATDTTDGKTVKLKPSAIPAKDRKQILGADYQKSDDRIVTISGDGTGLHVLTGKAKDGYALKTAATLYEEGFASDTWIGNHCVTESGKYAAVAYAPRMFTNKPELMVRGAFTAIVDLDSGKVTKLPNSASLAYFSPGCGNGDDAVFTQLTHDEDTEQKTRLITVDAATGKTAKPAVFPGQVTSAVPTKDGIAAAHGNKLVRIKGSKEIELARTRTVPFQITADAAGGVTFIDRELDKKADITPKSWAKRIKGTAKPVTLAEGNLDAWDLTSSAEGNVFITGKAKTKSTLPTAVANPGGLTKGALVSSHGLTAATTQWSDGKTTLINPEDADQARPTRVSLKSLATEETATLDVTPSAGHNGGVSPSLPGAEPQGDGGREIDSEPESDGMSTQMTRTQAIAAFTDPKPGSASDPKENADERTCAVPRNDVKLQAFQPTPRQVEWAVDQAVVGELKLTRPANWKDTGIGAYTPQSMFQPIVLAGDPNGTLDNEDPDVTDKYHIPSQVMLGITAQETNMWQATRFAVPGVTANSLVGNYYGVDFAASGQQNDPWSINWFDADCGYGITQATDGMRLPNKGQDTLSTLKQQAVAVDYTVNIAAGAQILSHKWNDTYKAGLRLNNGHPQYIENWFFALWAYNSGFHPTADSAGHKGVGWTNNPANPLWKANRPMFLERAGGGDDYSHAAHPQDWPYEEKVIGWAARPISAMSAPGDFAPGYLAAWWKDIGARSNAQPPVDLFCDSTNHCNPSKIGDNDSNDQGQGACTLDSGTEETNPHWLHCWWDHAAPNWKDCQTLAQCGNAVHRFDTSYPEQPDGKAYPPRCSSGLPDGTLVVDNLPKGTTPTGSTARGCGPVESDGTFSFSFGSTSTTMERPDDSTLTMTTYPSKIDTHQIGAGYGDHFWFAHTRQPETHPSLSGRMKVTGKWTLGQSNIGWARVLVHMPDHGAHTRQAVYTVGGSNSKSPNRAIQQRVQKNSWVNLGVFQFTGTPSVSLSNFTEDGDGSEDVAWDAVAFQKLPRKPADQIVALGDSFSSGEGASEGNTNYYPESNYRSATGDSTRDACHRSNKAWSRQATLPGMTKSIGELADTNNAGLDYKMVACSGARSYNIDKYGQNSELSQIKAGYLDQNTTLVTMSIGGNDARFTPIIQKCILAGDNNCADSIFDQANFDDTKVAGDEQFFGKAFKEAVPGLITSVVRRDILATIEKIHEKAPNARILLMGYPVLVSGDGSCLKLNTGLPYGLSPATTQWLGTVATHLAKEMGNAVTDAKNKGIDAKFANPISKFSGKGICGDPESIHGIVTKLVDSDKPAVDWPILKDYGLSAQSFHPKIAGARLYADVLEASLNGWAP
ncbi:SGNH/GDSL hydrolase family protein [Streptomyces sp. NPDC059010]|uniref:SGNH/GDSL hydrolase family protein n=1 Tax=Streptomyces sp. NPDC059010 TaxID=3346695 RepID=UPI00369B8DBD